MVWCEIVGDGQRALLSLLAWGGIHMQYLGLRIVYWAAIDIFYYIS